MSNTIYIVLGLVLVAGGVFMFFKNKGKGGDTSTTSTPVSPVNQAEQKVQGIMSGLLALNIEARDNSLPGTVITELESVIDKVRAIAEDVNKPENYSELTVSVNRMHSKYIPSLVNPYIALDADGKIKYEATIIEKLQVLGSELTSIKEEIDSQDFSEFEKRSRFISGMFDNDTAENIFN